MAHPSWGGPCKGTIKTVVLSNGVKLPVRQELAELIGRLSEETMRRGYRFVPGWCWGYACRKIRGTNTWSNHAWGLAVDINAPKNPHKRPLTTDMPKWMWDLWESYGFRWGGRYSKPDTMHYEFMGSVQDAQRQTERARRELGGQPAPQPQPTPPGTRPYPGGSGYRRNDNQQAFDGNVKWIQDRLNGTNLHPKIAADGFFGAGTERAVKGFQGAQGLKQDGVVGPATWAKLGQW